VSAREAARDFRDLFLEEGMMPALLRRVEPIYEGVLRFFLLGRFEQQRVLSIMSRTHEDMRALGARSLLARMELLTQKAESLWVEGKLKGTEVETLATEFRRLFSSSHRLGADEDRVNQIRTRLLDIGFTSGND